MDDGSIPGLASFSCRSFFLSGKAFGGSFPGTVQRGDFDSLQKFRSFLQTIRRGVEQMQSANDLFYRDVRSAFPAVANCIDDPCMAAALNKCAIAQKHGLFIFHEVRYFSIPVPENGPPVSSPEHRGMGPVSHIPGAISVNRAISFLRGWFSSAFLSRSVMAIFRGGTPGWRLQWGAVQPGAQ